MTFFGIYKMTNKVNGKMYIGQHITDDLDDGYMGSGAIMKKALKKYGEDAFTKEWLEFAENAEDLNYLERMYVNEEWLARPDTYNLVLGGSSHPQPMSIRKRISNTLKGHSVSEKSRSKMSTARKGRKYSDETKAKMSAAHKGQKHGPMSEETKQKLRIANIGFKNPNYGKPRSQATKMKIGAKSRGRRHSEETRKRISERTKIGMAKYFEQKRNLQCKN